MKRIVQFLLTAAMVMLAATASAQPVPPRATAYATAPDIPYESVPNFLKLPPNIYLGEGIGVARNSKGHIFIFTRSGDTRLFEFDQNGTFVREIGQGLYGFEMAHGVRVDSQDNIWTVDEGTNMVVKFNPEGRVLMTMGRRPEAVEGLEPTATPVPFNASASACTQKKDGKMARSTGVSRGNAARSGTTNSVAFATVWFIFQFAAMIGRRSLMVSDPPRS